MGVFAARPGTELLTTSDRPAAHPGAAISHLGSLRCPPCPCFSKSTPCNHGAQPASCSPVIGPVAAAKAGIPDTRKPCWHRLYASPFHVSRGSRCQVAGCGFCLCPQDALVLTLGCGGTNWKRRLQADSCLHFLGPGSGICCLGRFTVVSLSICPLLGNCFKPAPICTSQMLHQRPGKMVGCRLAWSRVRCGNGHQPGPGLGPNSESPSL